MPLADWPGNCHHVACLVRDLVPVPGMRIARGHFTGPVARGSIYHGGPQQHTWLLLADGRILDPTRWAMTRPERPEIYLGPCDHYDEGGRAMAAAVPPPFPGTGPDLTAPFARLDAEHRTALRAACGLSGMASDSLLSETLRFELKRDPDELAPGAAQRLYSAVDRAGLRAMIPMDSWMRVMAPEALYCQPGANRFFHLPPAERPTTARLFAALLARFCVVEYRAGLEDDLAEFGVSLKAYHDALDRLARWDMPLGFMLRDDRYAASLGYDGDAFAAAYAEITAAFGLSCLW